MRLFNNVPLILLLVFFGLFPKGTMASKDSGFNRHRISILPTQILLKEFSLFYEDSLAPWCAIEGSMGIQIYHGRIGLLNHQKHDLEFERGFVARCNIKLFPLPQSRTLYFAPMRLLKFLSKEETLENVETRGGPAVHIHQQSRMVLGGYGLIGFRTPGKIYFDFYGGFGLRYFKDSGHDTYRIPSQPDDQNIIDNSTVLQDFKLGFKVGIVLS